MSNSTEPKFKVGDIVYHIIRGDEQYSGSMFHGQVLGIAYTEDGSRAYHVDLPKFIIKHMRFKEAWILEKSLYSFEEMTALKLMGKIEDSNDEC